MPKYADGYVYHVYNRGAHKARIFAADDDYRRLLSLFGKYSARYSVSLVAYCLMPNHYHLLLRQDPRGSISDFLKTSFNAFVQAINFLRKHSGTLFQGSAKGILVDSDDYAAQLVCYIHLNPVMARLAKRPEDWEFSDYREWADLRKGRFFDPAYRGRYFRGSAEYRKLVEEYSEKKETIRRFLLD